MGGGDIGGNNQMCLIDPIYILSVIIKGGMTFGSGQNEAIIFAIVTALF